MHSDNLYLSMCGYALPSQEFAQGSHLPTLPNLITCNIVFILLELEAFALKIRYLSAVLPLSFDFLYMIRSFAIRSC